MHSAIVEQAGKHPSSVSGWVNCLIDWLIHNEAASQFCFGVGMPPLQTIGGVKMVSSNNYATVMETLRKGMSAWLTGETLSKVEEAMGGTLDGEKIYCRKARQLATNIAPRCLSYFSTFIVQITKKVAEQNVTQIANLAVLESLPAAIARGIDSPQKLAFMALTKTQYRSRVETHLDFNRRLNTLEIPEDSGYSFVKQLVASKLT
ncbi:hypothetical protein HF329_03925 [Chitinophaga oryzae]|uniref:Uncharacterized protein n=1 Tax=Chitinophaga oryzae TaxID=2725414 RepID=A0AAE7D5V4_9BACT|nr:hypothetical protein [Chitinophaga oryzae]QJB30494.1 hypothetical protein HF329_03925 [Chitinophaga oryzae]